MKAEKYILQYGSLAGWPFQVASALRKQGISSHNVFRQDSWDDVADLDRRLPHDRSLMAKNTSRLNSLIARGRFVREVSQNCSLVHYHGGVILKNNWHHVLEGRLFAKSQIPMVMSFGGGDCRFTSQARLNNPYFYRSLDTVRDTQIHAYLTSISRYIRYVATTPECINYVEPYFEKCHIFRQPVDLDAIRFVSPNIDRPPILLHIPTEPLVKGTNYILDAVKKLQSEGLKFEFRYKRQLTQKEMIKEIGDCDVYIDELLCGDFGVTAVETMAAGKPTVTFIRDDLVDSHPNELPIVNANPDTIYARLKELICDPSIRYEISHASRKYAERYHKREVVVEQLVDFYKSIGWTQQ